MNNSTAAVRMQGTKGEWLTRIGVSAWFFALACFSVVQILATKATALDTLGWARLISTISLFSFFLMIAWLTVVRPRPLAQARGWLPRVAALLGTWLFLIGTFFLPHRTDLGVTTLLLSAALILLGDILAVVILRRLGKSFSIMAEARKLVTAGPYSVVRHPLYAAEELAALGALIQFASLEAVLLFMVQFGFQVLRMRNEELVLRQTFPAYSAYMARTPRLIPGVW
ncbi:MAG: Isoprenylcysteine carboxyl methyltransferase [Rhodospirillales bacterium]|nr:Isoprenylcysteine carboxyl methyltransferase [Rhodospirillales bacterium]